MVDLLVISHACVLRVNRAAYREIKSRGWAVEIVAPSNWQIAGKTVDPDPSEAGDPPLHALPITSGHPRFYLFDGISRLLEQLSPRIVLVDNDPACRLAFVCGSWTRRNGSRLMCISCENLSRGLLASMKRAGVKGLLGAALVHVLNAVNRSRIDHVFAISQDGKAVLTALGYGGAVSVTPLGFDGSLFRPDPESREMIRKRLGLSKVTIAYFGRLVPEKGVHLLIEALGRLQHRDWQFLINRFDSSGNQYLEELAEQIRDLELESRLVFFDAKHHEMPQYMNAADITALASISTARWKEQYGRVAPEAMACGNAVVVSDSGALPELVADAGVVVPEGDVDALAMTIDGLLNDADRRIDLGHRAVERATSKLSASAQADVLERQMRELMQQSS